MIHGLHSAAAGVFLCSILVSACESRAVSRADTSGAVITSAQPLALGQFIPMTGDSVGPLSVAANRADLDRIARVIRDTTEEGDEGMSQEIAIVVINGDTVRAVLDDKSRVFAYFLRSPRFRTRDTLGVGTSLGQLLRIHGAYARTGEGQVFVRFPQHCGLHFRLSESGDLGDSPDSIGPSSLSGLPKDTRVSEVVVRGCRPNGMVAPPT
jgi:hypothetical protein